MQAAAVLSAFETALPDDARIERKLMFGTPCAFVNRQMFFGTFEDTLVARVGPERVKVLADQPGVRVFSLSEGKVWDDYVQLDPTAALLRVIRRELPRMNVGLAQISGPRVAAHEPRDFGRQDVASVFFS